MAWLNACLSFRNLSPPTPRILYRWLWDCPHTLMRAHFGQCMGLVGLKKA